MSVGAVDKAVIAKLQTISSSVIPGGVWYAVAPANVADPFVIVQLTSHIDEDYEMRGGAHIEIARYMVKAVAQDTKSTQVAAAEDAIYTALQDQPLTVAGYTHMLCHREERMRELEIDGDLRWQHRAQTFAVWVTS
jgi:hypothetical protein